MSKSDQLFEQARQTIPGGVNSPVRAFNGVGGTPRFIDHADGAYLYDVDGQAYVDYIGSWGPMLLGHNHPAIKAAVIKAVEDHFIAEVIEPDGSSPVADGEIGELVLTNLGRVGSPNIRYRTGDMVRKSGNQLVGGILGRADDMIHIRGNNVYPSAIEAVIFRQPDVAEFQIHLDQINPLVDLRIVVEPRTARNEDQLKQIIERSIRDELLFRAEVTVVPPGTLPRSEMKPRRVLKT